MTWPVFLLFTYVVATCLKQQGTLPYLWLSSHERFPPEKMSSVWVIQSQCVQQKGAYS